MKSHLSSLWQMKDTAWGGVAFAIKYMLKYIIDGVG